MGCWPSWRCGWLQSCAHCCCSASRERIMHITNLWIGPSSKFRVQFLWNAYHFHSIIKLKNCKLNHCKSVAICISKSFFVSIFFYSSTVDTHCVNIIFIGCMALSYVDSPWFTRPFPALYLSCSSYIMMLSAALVKRWVICVCDSILLCYSYLARVQLLQHILVWGWFETFA